MARLTLSYNTISIIIMGCVWILTAHYACSAESGDHNNNNLGDLSGCNIWYIHTSPDLPIFRVGGV